MWLSLDDLTLFAYIFLFSFLGAFSKDMLDTFLDRTLEILIGKVLISSFAVSVLIYGASEHILKRLSYRPFTALCYTLGLISFEVMVRYSNMKDILNLIKDFKKWRNENNK